MLDLQYILLRLILASLWETLIWEKVSPPADMMFFTFSRKSINLQFFNRPPFSLMTHDGFKTLFWSHPVLY